VSPIKLVPAAIVLALGLSACGADNPPGTISEDDLPNSAEVDKVSHDDQAGQVTCSDVNDAEDNYLMTPSENYDKDRRAAVAYELAGSHFQTVSNSTWRLTHVTEVLDRVAAGIDKCVKAQPDVYQRFDVKGYPSALGYTEEGGYPTPSYTRRILVPLDDRVVIVTARRQGGDDFAVAPEDLLKKAVDASADAPEA
jgi:hypothetical protein